MNGLLRDLSAAAGALIIGCLLTTGVGIASPNGGATTAAAAPATSPKEEGAVTFTTSDGVTIYGVYGAGRPGAPGVVFLPMLGRTHTDWTFMAESFRRAGFHTLSIDLRGHGASTQMVGQEDPLEYGRFRPAEFNKMTEDVQSAVAWLRSQPGVAGENISLVGASIGANVALAYGAKDAQISRVALLSPGLDYKGVATEDAIAAYGNRPLFMAVSREDSYAAKSVLVLDALSASESKEVKIFTGAGHGTKMLSREPSLETGLLGWVSGASDESSGSVAKPPVIPSKAP